MVQLIIGHVTTSTAKIWVKANGVAIKATVTLTPAQNNKQGNKQKINDLHLLADRYYTGVTEFTNLDPDTLYTCKIIFDQKVETLVEGTLRTMPIEVDEINFLLGSCHLSLFTDHVSPEFKRIDEIAKDEKSRFILTCGDQMYIDTAVHPFWITSRDGYAERYEETWHSLELKQVFGNLPQYMLIDDHEIYNDFINENLSRKQQQLFSWASDAYKIFQHAHNPGDPDRFYYSFDCAHAVFFVMDARTERTGNYLISNDQFDTLTSWINDTVTKDKIKIIVSSVPLITQLDQAQQNDKWSGTKYYEQRDKILKVLMGASNKKIVFLSGDIHLSSHAYITYEANGKTYRINELISSPIKQAQFNILHDEPNGVLIVNKNPYDYFLCKHMGYPVKKGEMRLPLRNNIMSISVKTDRLSYKVYALIGNEMLFENEVLFEEP
ncbi:MAG: alkaline phosphatase D family protein [Niastella sp.]|uniref:alkaline phosphatase D family protein n=1 Tax=Niastella sp. TaxID=1869183 RepID=UPI00389AAB1C